MPTTKNQETRTKQPVLDRARADFQAGRPDKARDRLTGYLSTLQSRGEYSGEVYALLGEVHFAMKNFAHAGAAWLLSERESADVDFAVKAFFERHNVHDFRNILRALKPRLPLEAFPPRVQQRLKDWGYKYAPYQSRAEREAEEAAVRKESRSVRPIEAGCLLFAALAVLFILYYFMVLAGARR